MTTNVKFEVSLLNIILLLSINVIANKNPHMSGGRKAIVHLFEWKWSDVADECERFLGPMGFGGVQVSPAAEHAILAPDTTSNSVWRPWYERYQPVSYKLISRSGNELQFQDMVERCNVVDVRIYVDVVINHMTAENKKGYGSGNSFYDSEALNYTGVPYSNVDFNSCAKCNTSSCTIENYTDSNQARNCRLLGLKDLDQSKQHVRDKIIGFLNHLISLGVAGFRVDAAKHMFPNDLAHIYSNLTDLNTEWFKKGLRPFIYQEVIDFGGNSIHASEYTDLGRVTEFKYGFHLDRAFRRHHGLANLRRFGKSWAMMNSSDALVFIDNHDNQRGHGINNQVLTHKEPKLYKIATVFMLAWPYGIPRIMSSYSFDTHWKGPPSDEANNTLSVKINDDLSCADGWICEHRWKEIYGMVQFGRYVGDVEVNDWWCGNSQQIAFSRGDKGFIAINNEDFDLKATIQTGLPPGRYCDVISGSKANNGTCTGRLVNVKHDRSVDLEISNSWDNPMIAIHGDSKIN